MTTGIANIFIGHDSAKTATVCNNNVIIGTDGGNGIQTSTDNVMIGNDTIGPTAGIGNNVVVGALAQTGALGNNVENCVILGAFNGSTNVSNNRLMIGNPITGANPLIDGDFATRVVTINNELVTTGKVTLGDATTTHDINGPSTASATAGIIAPVNVREYISVTVNGNPRKIALYTP